MGEMGNVGQIYGHSGVGHGNVSSLYAFPELPSTPVAAFFKQGSDEGITEFEAVRLTLGQ
jgi:hypothetical protein